ncbi:MAG: ankyrin repeat domain-containing protein [Candidatus Aminicenantes bacterium]|nr:ankyrin repeat domain-containing protein [Candidatus Aminicenantes bacterium]
MPLFNLKPLAIKLLFVCTAKKKILVLGVLMVFLFAALNMANAENQQIHDRDLFLAIKSNNLELFQGYLAGKANWNATDSQGNTLIHALIATELVAPAEPESPPREVKRGLVESPRAMAVRKISVQVPLSRSGTMNNSLPMRMGIIRRLVGRGVDLNKKNNRGETPLLLAVRKARLEEDLLPQVSKVFFSAKNYSGNYHGIEPDLTLFLPFFNFLLNLGADPRLGDGAQRTPVFYATAELFPLLLQHGAALEDRDQEGLTPFLYAKTKAALALLRLGADPQVTDNLKRNRWHYLQVNLWEELAQKLIELGVNINQQDLEGRTPLLLCCHERDGRRAKYLAEHGADLSLADNNGQTPLLAATRESNLGLMEWLLQKGAPMNVRDRSGISPLLFSQYNKTKIELLLRYKADPNIQDNNGNTILHLLADSGNPEALELLLLCLRNGASVNQRNRMGETPLIKAFNHVDLSKLKLLMENGADPNVLTARNETLLDLAQKQGRKEALSLLRRYGAQYKRSWFDRHPQALIISYAFLGIIPLFTFLFSLNKPSLFTRKMAWFFIAPVGLFLLLLLVRITGGLSSGGEGLLILILAMPPFAALLMSLSGTRNLAERCPPGLGIPLSILNAAGCMGLTLGIVFLFLPGTHGEGGILLAYDALIGGGAAAVITLVFGFFVWKKRLAPVKKTDCTRRSTEIPQEQAK